MPGSPAIGESIGATDAAAVLAALRRVTPDLIGHDAFDIARLTERLHRKHFGGVGPRQPAALLEPDPGRRRARPVGRGRQAAGPAGAPADGRGGARRDRLFRLRPGRRAGGGRRPCPRARRPGLRGDLPEGRARRRAGRRQHPGGPGGDRRAAAAGRRQRGLGHADRAADDREAQGRSTWSSSSSRRPPRARRHLPGCAACRRCRSPPTRWSRPRSRCSRSAATRPRT